MMTRVELQIFLTVVACIAVLQAIAIALQPGGSIGLASLISLAVVGIVVSALRPMRPAPQSEAGDASA